MKALLVAAAVALLSTPVLADHMPPTDSEIPLVSLIQAPQHFDLFWYELDGVSRLCARTIGLMPTETDEMQQIWMGTCLSLEEIQAMPKYTFPEGMIPEQEGEGI